VSIPFRYSTIQTYLKCPQLYKLRHIDGLSDGSERNADLRFGTVMHLAIQDLFEGGDGLTVFSVYWATVMESLDYGRLGWDDLNHIGRRLIEIFRDEHMSKFSAFSLELKQEQQLGKHWYSGTVDFLGEMKGVGSVVDWKTSAYPYDAYKIRCNEQMHGYAYLSSGYMQAEGIPLGIEQLVYGVAIKDPKNPRWQFKVESLDSRKHQNAIDNIESICDKISEDTEAGKFHKNASSCVVGKNVCPFFERCHGGQEDK
jgi:hypothetical protein